jgi:hypothetical protein
VKHKTYPDCGCEVIKGFDDYCPLCRLTNQNELLAEIPTMCRRYEQRIAELEGDLYAQSLAKHQAFETVRAWEVKYAELEAEVGDLTARCYSLLSFAPDDMMISEVRKLRDQMVAKLARAEAAEAALERVRGLVSAGYVDIDELAAVLQEKQS